VLLDAYPGDFLDKIRWRNWALHKCMFRMNPYNTQTGLSLEGVLFYIFDDNPDTNRGNISVHPGERRDLPVVFKPRLLASL